MKAYDVTFKRIAYLLGAAGIACLAVLGLLWPAHAAPAPVPAADRQVCPSGCAYSSIQEAVDAASPGDVIKVAQGVYSDVRNVASLNTGVFTATQIVVITKSLTLRGGYNDDFTAWDPAVYRAVLDARGLGRGVVITGAVTPTVEGLYVTGGNAAGLGGNWRDFGSWIWKDDVGGGLYIYAATAVISGNAIYSNTANAGGGAFLFNSAAALHNNTIYSHTISGSGAGVYLSYSDATLDGNVITGNHSDSWGGGIHVSVSSATLNDNVITGNRSTGYGGGVSLESSAAALNGNVVAGNTGDYGGGLLVYWSNAVLRGNVIAGNVTPERGGGLYIEGGAPTLINTVVADNQAVGQGVAPGMFIIRAAPRLLHTTIARNAGGDGSGLYVTDNFFELSRVALTNTILVSHTVGITVTSGNTVTLDATLWRANPGGNWHGNVVEAHPYNGDPAFALDGYHILTGSLALDRGIAAGVTEDIDGDARPQGAGYDLGADELPSAPPGVAWGKRVSVNGGAFQDWDAEPFTVAPGDVVVIVDRVWVTGTGSVSFALTDTWTSSLVWGGYTASSGSVAQVGNRAAWTADSVPTNAWHTLTQTFTAASAPTYADTLTETLIVQGLALQLPERIVEFEQLRPQPLWDKTVRVNAGSPQPWNAGQFTVQDGDTLTIVDRVWVTHTSNVTFTLVQAWGPGLMLQGQAYDAETVVTATGALTWYGSGDANWWLALTTTLRVSGSEWLYESITETLTVADAASQLPQRQVNLLNLSGVAGCYVRINDGSTDYHTVQSAIDAAQPGDVVKVAGRCTAVNDNGGLAQIAYITKSITLRGGYTTTNWVAPDPAAHPTTLDAGGRGRALYVAGDSAPTIAGLRITGGDATGLGGMAWGDVGGGVYVNGGGAVISGNVIFSNTAPDAGGGLFLVNSGATLVGNVIQQNYMPGGGTGAGVSLYDCSGALNGNTIRDNRGHDWGGGVQISGGAPTLSGNLIAGNRVVNGGGGVSISSGSGATLDGNIISGNAAGHGAGVSIYFSSPTLARTVVVGNAAQDSGGGLHLDGGAPTLVNTAVVGNRAGQYGAGVFAYRAVARLLHTTVSANTGGDGSGLYVTGSMGEYSTLALTNTIVAGHTVGVAATAGNAAVLNATLWHGNGVTHTGSVATLDDRYGDPVFAPDGYHLGSTSAALDWGVNAGVAVDVDGQARPLDAGYDPGADEFTCVPVAGVQIAGPAQGEAGAVYTFTAILTPPSVSPPITYTWNPPPAPGSLLLPDQSVVAYAWGATGAYTIAVTAANCGDSATATHTITVTREQYMYLPLVMRNQ